MRANIAQVDNACRFASEIGVDVSSDLESSWPLQPVISRIDAEHEPVTHMTDKYGMDYYEARIAYLKGQYVKVIRLVNVVMPGFRSKMAFTLNGSSAQDIRVHKGSGYLILGSPDNVEGEPVMAESFRVDPKVNQRVTIPPGKFYTFESAYGSHYPLVISSLYRQLELKEVEFLPGTEEISVEGGHVVVPDEFFNADFN